MNPLHKAAIALTAMSGLTSVAMAQDPAGAQELMGLSIEELMDVQVVTPSRAEEDLWNAPASMVVITSADIEARGYTDISELIMDLPGFDVSVVNGGRYMVAYQRGYRTPATQRTLVMVDGIVDNSLFTQAAALSRQYPISTIDRVEVLYGPASAVYGPNAFLGIIQIITKDAAKLASGEVLTRAHILGGSFNTRGVGAGLQAREGNLSFSSALRVFRSDEPDYSNRFAWTQADNYANEDIWGPIVTTDMQNAGVPLGTYHDPTDDYSALLKLKYKGVTFGLISWRTKEGFGPYYAGDRAQANAFWRQSSNQIYSEIEQRVSDRITFSALALYRISNISGDWSEASPDPDDPTHSFVSRTEWRSQNDSYLARPRIQWEVTEHFSVDSGIRVARRELTKQYDVPGYWLGSFGSSQPADFLGPEGEGGGIFHSSSDTYILPPGPAARMPNANLILVDDVGGYSQVVADWNGFWVHAGLRADNNSLYKTVLNPRVSVAHHGEDVGPLRNTAVRLTYGTAFQEPAPNLLWGGWNGRDNLPDLTPEHAKSVDMSVMFETAGLFVDLTGFHGHYTDVIAETADNIGMRNTYGAEARSRWYTPNPLPADAPVAGDLSYTWTQAMSERFYDFETGDWEKGQKFRDLGDIAPHKVHGGLFIPVTEHLDVGGRTSWISGRKLYLRNALRDPSRPDGGRTLPAYTELDFNMALSYGPARLMGKVKNALDAQYFHPGAEKADTGDDRSAVRSSGWMNSLVPQPGRAYYVTLTMDF